MTQEEIRLNIIEIHSRDGFRCQHPKCNRGSDHVAHRCAKTKSNKSEIKERLIFLGLDKVISVEKVIHHEFNLVASCVAHNSSFNIGNNPIKKSRLLTKIIKDLQDKL